MSTGRRAGLLALLACCTLAMEAASQAPAAAGEVRFQTGVSHDTVTVGEPFQALVRVTSPDGTELQLFPLPVTDSLEPVDSLQVVEEAEGTLVVYTAVGWVAGEPLEAVLPFGVTPPGGETTEYHIRLRLPVVRSVLPADTTLWSPQPAKGALAAPGAASPLPWWWLLIALLLATVAALLAWWWMRRAPVAEASEHPRERAMRALEEAEAALAAGDAAYAYERMSQAARRYLAEVDPELGAELTTSELIFVLHRRPRPIPQPELQRLLTEADRVKFGRYPATVAEARQALAAARAVVTSYPAGEERALREAA